MRGKMVCFLLVGVGVFACAANAAVLSWEFTVHPTQEAVPMMEAKGSDGTGTGYGSGQGLLGDGTAEFGDAPYLSGNYGFYLGGGTGPFTMDIRVKVLEDVLEGKGKSLSFADSTGNGRGMKLRPGGIELVDGSGVVRGYGPVDLTQWIIIRNSFPGNGTVDTLVWNGSAFVHLGNQGLGGSGWSDVITPAGVGIGSLAGSSTQSGKFLIDWVYIDTAAALGDTPPPLPEPATLAMLTLCAIPLLRRRH